MQRIRVDRRIIIKNLIFLLVLVALILIDQITKTVVKNLYENSGWVYTSVISGFFEFRYAFNTGAAFSFLADASWGQIFFKILTSIALVAFYIYYVYVCKKGYTFLRIAMIIVIAGTIGNLIDRLAYNGVVDFLSFTFGAYKFPIFNLADTYMTIGAIMVVVHYFFLDENAIFTKKNDKKTVSDK